MLRLKISTTWKRPHSEKKRHRARNDNKLVPISSYEEEEKKKKKECYLW